MRQELCFAQMERTELWNWFRNVTKYSEIPSSDTQRQNSHVKSIVIPLSIQVWLFSTWLFSWSNASFCRSDSVNDLHFEPRLDDIEEVLSQESHSTWHVLSLFVCTTASGYISVQDKKNLKSLMWKNHWKWWWDLIHGDCVTYSGRQKVSGENKLYYWLTR